MARTTIRVRAHAKINLLLHVGARQPDGYHPLETVFQSLTLHDTLSCEVSRSAFTVTCDDPAVPTDSSNLVWQAARALWRHVGRAGEPRGCRVALAKQIPMAAGLGGGSADAAAALVGLNRLWGARVPIEMLARLGATLGADVPFFLTGGTALGLGRGDRLWPLVALEPRHVVLAQPAFGVSTAAAYGWFDADAADAPVVERRAHAWSPGQIVVHNDLQAPVVRRHPEVGALVARLLEDGAEAAAMTGSGSVVFGLFASGRAAHRAAQRVAASGVLALVTRTADRVETARGLGL